MPVAMVADDDPDIRELIAFKLEQAGYRVLTAADGSDALALVRRAHIDVAVLDVRMPGATGLTICRHLRDDHDTGDLSIIMVTACAQDEDIEAGYAAGADDFVTKPFSPRELTRRLAAVVARRAMVPALAAG